MLHVSCCTFVLLLKFPQDVPPTTAVAKNSPTTFCRRAGGTLFEVLRSTPKTVSASKMEITALQKGIGNLQSVVFGYNYTPWAPETHEFNWVSSWRCLLCFPPPPSNNYLQKKKTRAIISGVVATISRDQLRKRTLWELFSWELRKFSHHSAGASPVKFLQPPVVHAK